MQLLHSLRKEVQGNEKSTSWFTTSAFLLLKNVWAQEAQYFRGDR